MCSANVLRHWRVLPGLVESHVFVDENCRFNLLRSRAPFSPSALRQEWWLFRPAWMPMELSNWPMGIYRRWDNTPRLRNPVQCKMTNTKLSKRSNGMNIARRAESGPVRLLVAWCSLGCTGSRIYDDSPMDIEQSVYPQAVLGIVCTSMSDSELVLHRVRCCWLK